MDNAMPSRAELEAATEEVHRHILPTPQIPWPLLAARCGCEVWVKHENHTPIGAFKVRGGLTYMAALKDAHPEVTGVITATTGNHGQSVAYAAKRHGLTATVVVPLGNSPEKTAAMGAFGAEVVEHGHDFQAAYEHTLTIAEGRGLHLIRSWHPWLVRGVGTYGMEFFQAASHLDRVYVPIGLGSGICGTIAARDALGLKTEVVGVVAENAAAYNLSFRAGRPISTNSADTFAAGVACRTPDEDALRIILKGAVDVIAVSEDAMLEAMGHYFQDTHNAAEGAGAAPLAALLKERERMRGKAVGLILSGGNADRPLFMRALERSQVGDRP